MCWAGFAIAEAAQEASLVNVSSHFLLRLSQIVSCQSDLNTVLCADIASSGTAAAAPHEATHCGLDWSDCLCHELLHAVP